VTYRGTSAQDPNLDVVARIQEPAAKNLGTPTSTGTLTAAAQPWQTLPPAHGSQYSYYEGTYQEDIDSNGTPDQIVTRLWIDTATKFPIHAQKQVSGGAMIEDTYFTYGVGRITSEEAPPDLFLATPPRLTDETKTVTYTGNAPQGNQTDVETGASYTPYYLGAAPALASGSFCLMTADIVKEGALPADQDEVPPDADGPFNLNGPITYNRAIYERLAPGAVCAPGVGRYDTPPLTVQSMASTSAYAAAIREQYQETAQYVEAVPSDEDFLRSGVRPSLLGLTPVVAYIIKLDDETSGALIETNGTTLVVTGPFDKTSIQDVVAQLVAR
jgi:hypothetical protein